MGDSIINGLAVIGAVSCVYWVFRGGAALLRFAQESPQGADPLATAGATPRPKPALPPDLESDIPVIAAAVYAMMGPARILHIEGLHPGTIWTAEGRLLQQTSHSPAASRIARKP